MNKFFSILFILFYNLTIAQNFSQKNLSDLLNLPKITKQNDGFIPSSGIVLKDLDNNGWNDIVYYDGSNIVILSNLNNNFYFTSADLSFDKETIIDFGAEDLNNDGLIDLVVAASGKQKGFYILKNTGHNNFCTEKTIMSGKNISNNIYSNISFIDQNKDGNIDILYSFWEKPNDSYFYSNILLENFQKEEFKRVKLFINKSNFDFDNDNTPFLKIDENIRVKPLSLGTYSADFNRDNSVDILQINDINSPDLIINGNKYNEFSYKDYLLNSMSLFSMGADIADINNDGLNDIFTADMRPKGNYRQKSLMFETPYTWKIYQENPLLLKQKSSNSLHLNCKNYFLEVAQYSKLDATDWSWSPLIADFDNDGLKDLFITAGVSFDFEFNFDAPYILEKLKLENKNIDSFLNQYPIDSALVNKFYKNLGDLQFEEKTKQWYDPKTEISSGAAYGDIDNDGDIDIVFSIKNKYPRILYNNLSSNNYLRIKIKDTNNKSILHTKIDLYSNNQHQYYEFIPNRGFYSVSEAVAHFGLLKSKIVDSIIIEFPNLKIKKIYNIDVNKELIVDNLNAYDLQIQNEQATIFKLKEIDGLKGIKHVENEYIDFSKNPLLPKFYSDLGPGVEVTDVNGDKLDDIILGNSYGSIPRVFLQDSLGKFNNSTSQFFLKFSKKELIKIKSIDYDNDNDNDLILGFGGNETTPNSDSLLVILLINDGNGNFTEDKIFPKIKGVFLTIETEDFDKDGDMDIFLGSRLKSFIYPEIPNSYILKNNNGVFKDITNQLNENIAIIGMVTSAIWKDINNDSWLDLVIVGEYMPITIFINEKGKRLVQLNSDKVFNTPTNGMWNIVKSEDINNDGYSDLVLGNIGLNTRRKASLQYPLKLYYSDFDNNGQKGIVTTYFENGNKYPTKQLQFYKSRINGLAKKYFLNEKFAKSSFKDIFKIIKPKESLIFNSYLQQSIIAINNKDNTFKIIDLPYKAQLAPINDLLIQDFNKDGNKDILLIANSINNEIEEGFKNSSVGLFIDSCILPLDAYKSGFIAPYVGRHIKNIKIGNKNYILVIQNNEKLLIFEY